MLYGKLRDGGAVIYTDSVPGLPAVLPVTSVSIAEQLSAEIDAGLPLDQLMLRLRTERDALREASKGADALALWAVRGTIYGVVGADVLLEEANRLRRHYSRLTGILLESIRLILNRLDDPNMLVAMSLDASLTDRLGLQFVRYGLASGPIVSEEEQGADASLRAAGKLALSGQGRRVIGADPGQTTGLAYIRNRMLVESAATKSVDDTFRTIFRWQQAAVDAGELVEGIGLERFGNLQFLSDARHDSLMQEGAVRTAAAILGIHIEEHTPEMISVYTRNAGARLGEVFGDLPTTPHERDALAHAFLYLQRYKSRPGRLQERHRAALERAKR